MPTNLYGPNDNFDEMTSHVLPSFLRRFHQAKIQNLKEVKIWGSGKPRREFLHVDDLATALLTLMDKHESTDFVNVGCGEDISIRELASTVAKIVGYKGEIAYDLSMPDGTPRKLLEISKITKLGWQPSISLEEGIRTTYEWALKNKSFEKPTATKVDEIQPRTSA
jgi:GDP-L-fucose synthase